jgi:hypothetical protein
MGKLLTTIQQCHHKINKNTYVIYWTPPTLQVPKAQFSFFRNNIEFFNSSDIVDFK